MGARAANQWDGSTVEQRFWPKVDRSGGPDACWPWLATTLRRGYGAFAINGSKVPAHRVAYELMVGPIPAGFQIDHVRCNNPPCVNPAHLEAVTQQVNNLRSFSPSAVNARKATCKHGHPFDAANTRLDRRGRRRCRACHRRAEIVRRACRAYVGEPE